MTFTRGMRIDLSTMLRISELIRGQNHLLRMDFTRAIFEEVALFGNVKFGEVSFRGARFHENARFFHCEFRESANFRDATFMGDVTFASSTFSGYANFVSATFHAAADFKSVQFGNDEVAPKVATFSGARFEGRAEFNMLGRSALDEIAPSDRVRLMRVTTTAAQLSLQDVTFQRYVDLEIHSARLNCTRARFLGGGQIRASRTLIDFEDAQFSSPVTVASEAGSPAAVSSLEGADVGNLLLSGVDLRDCRFRGSHNLDRLRMEATTVADVGWSQGFARRRLIAEEVYWRRANRWSRGWDRVTGVSATVGDPLKPSVIASIYRSLRKGREDSKDEPGAADFYYGEMEMRRHDNTRSAGERLVILAYWLLSGYGLRASRSLAALALVLLFATSSFELCGFAFPRDSFGPSPGGLATTSWDACRPGDLEEFAESVSRFDTWVFVTSSAIAVIPRPEVALTTQGQAIRLVLRILGPLLIGLAFLSLRGRVKR